MAFKNVLDSDVDRLTMYAIRGVNSFIELYEEERGEEQRLAAGPVSPRRPAAKPARLVAKKTPPSLKTSSKKTGGKSIRR